MSLDVAFTHSFGGFALDIAFKVERGVTALFGPSGSGKTSVVNAIAGLFKPREGRIVIAGRTVQGEGVFVPARARRAGYVFQDARLFPHMSVEDNLRFGWRRVPNRAPNRADEHEIEHVIDMLGLVKLLERRPRALSGGEKSRVALGRALLSAPDILLLDEPLAALDAARREEILPYLERLRDETRLPMVYVSHNVDEVARLADEVVLLRDGRVAAQGSVFELLTRIEAVGAVLDTRVAGERDGLTVLSFDGGTLLVPKLSRPSLDRGRVRARLRAEDIMLAREEPRAISANNILPATVVAVGAGAQADVQLALGNSRMVARITQASAARLGLAPGVRVFAIVKSVIIDH